MAPKSGSTHPPSGAADPDHKKPGAGLLKHMQKRKQADSNNKSSVATNAAGAALAGLGKSTPKASHSIPIPKKAADTSANQTMNRGGPASASSQDGSLSRTPTGSRGQGRVKFEPYVDRGDLQRALKRGHALK